MKAFNWLAVASLALGGAIGHAEIREIRKMSEIRPAITEQTLVVFDLDNTVMEPVQTLGTDQWFESLVAAFSKTDAATAVDRAVEIWSRVQQKTKMRPVENTTPALIRSLRKQGLHVIALTARPDALAPTTLAQLKSIGVSFERLISVGPKASKGEVLAKYVAESGIRFERVVFTDDKPKHVKTVDEALTQLGVENVEFRYGAADERVHALDPALAQVELGSFELTGELVSDEVARNMLDESRKTGAVKDPGKFAFEQAKEDFNSSIFEGKVESCAPSFEEAALGVLIIRCEGSLKIDGRDGKIATPHQESLLFVENSGKTYFVDSAE